MSLPEDNPDLMHHHQLQKKSGLSRAEYCRINGLDYSQLSHAARKSKKQTVRSSAKPIPQDFVTIPVQPYKPQLKVEQDTLSTFTLTLSDGSSLTWSTQWSAEQVLAFVTRWRVQS